MRTLARLHLGHLSLYVCEFQVFIRSQGFTKINIVAARAVELFMKDLIKCAVETTEKTEASNSGAHRLTAQHLYVSSSSYQLMFSSSRQKKGHH